MRWMTLTAVLASGISLAGEELTRAGQTAAERDQKERNLKAEELSKIEQRLNWVKDAGLPYRKCHLSHNALLVEERVILDEKGHFGGTILEEVRSMRMEVGHRWFAVPSTQF